MKTAISIPDPIFEAADRLARRLGLSRSELYARAVAAFVDRHRTEGLTQRLDELYGSSEVEGALDPATAAMQWASLPREDW